MSILACLFSAPLIGALFILLTPNIFYKNLKGIAVFFSLFPLLILLFNQGEEKISSLSLAWFPPLSLYFYLSVDTLSLLFIELTAVILPMSLLAASSKNTPFPKVFFSLALVLQSLLIGFFAAKDLALFTIFWESLLLPLYFMLQLGGGEKQGEVALKFMIYQCAGSCLLVLAVLSLYLSLGYTFNMDDLMKTAENLPQAGGIFFIFLLAFAVKTPLFPFHAWLPDTYTQGKTTASILLAALLSKAGIYGILRIGGGFFPQLLKAYSPLLLTLSIIGVFYGGLAAWMQKDVKRLVAYSSFSHVNFILVGIFSLSEMGKTGAILQAINHAITIAALFLVVGWLEEKMKSTQMSQSGGIAKYLPRLCWLTLFFVLASVAFPGTHQFVGEFLIFLGLFQTYPKIAAFLAFSLVLSVVYMLHWMQKVYFGTPILLKTPVLDLSGKEFLKALPLILLILWIGIYPSWLLNQIFKISM